MNFFFSLIFLFISLLACQRAGSEKKHSVLEQKGKAVYISQCVVCHNINPTLPGSVGPEIANSSLELIRARVMTATYPTNYKPKRQSRVMLAFPYLEKDIPALHAYLNSFKK